MGTPLLLIIEDDETIALSLRRFFEQRNCSVIEAPTGAEGLACALREMPDIVLLDLRLPDAYGIDVLTAIKKDYPDTPVIMMTGYGEIEEAVKAMKLGAEYYFQKPVDLDQIAIIVERSLGIRQMKQDVARYRESPFPVVGRSMQTQGLTHMISLLASNLSTTVLIQGETGTGKELVARNIHAMSDRRDRPFIDINCAAIPEHIVESELFGYEAGAFTDARKTKKGLIEMAEGGTLFLDEIGDMPRSAQAKVLRVLEGKTLKRLGGTRDITVDVRVIAATNKRLDDLVKNGLFREDLYYRLNVMPLTISPLRERTEDIPLIAGFLLDQIKKTMGRKEIGGFTQEAVDLLCSYQWPGNVRELRNAIERAAILCRSGDISAGQLALPNGRPVGETPMTLNEIERAHIQKVLTMTGNNKARTARILGIARSTLNEKIKSYRFE
jgi:DNA-binding NtrC family response regulator